MKRAFAFLILPLLIACQREESKQASGIPPYAPPSDTASSTPEQTSPPPLQTQTAPGTPMSSPIRVTTQAGSPIVTTSPNPVPFNTDSARRVAISQVREAIAGNDVVIVDVRTLEAYQKGHIPGAIHIPESEIVARANELPRDKMIVTYCT